jgi:hypothetical protein
MTSRRDSKAQSSKLKAPKKLQAPSSKLRMPNGSASTGAAGLDRLELGASLMLGAWNLKLGFAGAWSLEFGGWAFFGHSAFVIRHSPAQRFQAS